VEANPITSMERKLDRILASVDELQEAIKTLGEPMTHREVTKDEFYAAMNQNVHPTPVGKYPYTSIFKTPDGREVGRIDGQGKYLLVTAERSDR